MSTARTWSIDSSVISRHEFWPAAMSPTLLTRTSTPPTSENAHSAMRLMSSHEVMSPCTMRASVPAARTRSAVRSAPAAELR